MAEGARVPNADSRPAAGGLIGRTVALSARVGSLVRPALAGLRGLAVGRGGGRALAQHDYRAVPGSWGNRGSVALSTESGTLRVLRSFGQRVIGWGSVPLPPGVIRGGTVADASLLGDVLGETFAQLRLPRRRVSGAVSGLRASIVLLELPWVKEHELEEVVADEAGRALGVTTDDSYLFWQRLSGHRRERFVYVVAVPREPLLSTLEAYQAGGLHLEELDLKPLALARAVNQRDAIVVNIESDSLDVVIVVDDLPVLCRSLALPADLSYGDPAHEHVLVEVSRALASYEDAVVDQRLDPGAAIYLSGSRAAGIGLVERLRARTGHPMGRPAPPLHYPSDFPLAEQLANIGLALKRR
jgi:Tfp pilus assembly PilM family ATPase